MNSRIDQLVRTLSDSPHVHFGTPSDAPSEEWVEKAERRLGVKLPPSYRWWIRNYGGGDIAGEEIFSIYGVAFDDAVGGDIVFANEHRPRRNGRLVICDTGVDEEFYFDTSRPNSDGEYPVLGFEDPDHEYFYADDFIEFLTKRIDFFRSE